MAMIKADPASPQMLAIIDCLDEKTPKTMYEIADELGSSYWTLYPWFRKMEEMGLITAGPFRRDKKKTFTKTDLSRTPKIHLAGTDLPSIPLYKIALGAPTARAAGTTTGEYVNNFPYAVLRLYQLAASVEAGHDFDRAAFQGIRGDMVLLRNRMENMIGAVNELLAHPAMSGTSASLVDCLLSDPSNTLTREKIHDLMKECGE